MKIKHIHPDALWTFETKNFQVRWRISDDVLDVTHMEPELAAQCRRNVASGKWQCFESIVEVKHLATGLILGEAYLGNSIYADPRKFRDHFNMTKKGHGSYFRDMVTEAIAEARKNYGNLKQKVDAVTLKTKKSSCKQVA